MLNDTDIRRFLRSLPGPFLVVQADADFTIVGASDAYLRQTFTDASIFGRPLFEVFPDNPAQDDADGQARLRASLQRVIATGQEDRMPTQRHDVRRPDGRYEERYWTFVNAPVLADDGTVACVSHRADQAAAKANRDAIRILESITEGFFTLDRRWRFDYVNQEAHRILGKEPGALSGQVLWQVYPGLEGTEFERNYHRSMFGREKSSFTAFYPHQDRWYEVTTFPAPEGVSVYFRNVTDQKNLEADRQRLMAESERQRRIFETALDATPDFFFVFDLQHRILYANEALLATWGVKEARGRRLTSLGYEPWHADLHERELRQVIATRQPVRGEIPFTGPSGRRLYDYIFAPVVGAAGEVVAVAGTTRDVTERKLAEQSAVEHAERLAQTDLAKDEFLATLSHELRNPLAPLRNAAHLLRTTVAGDPQAMQVHAMMDRQINHLSRLVDDLLEMSRISRGTLSLRNDRVEVATVVRNAVETNAGLVQAAGHAVRVALPEQPLWLAGDPVRLTQILDNLLNNAVKYTPDGGRLLVEAWSEYGDAFIRVSDNGIGIAPRLVPRLFEMFSRGDRDTARQQTGLGIGLALSRRLAHMHNGTLEARSEGPGQGSAFTLRLPLADAPPAADASAAAAPAGLAQVRVLVVDDNRDAADSTAMMLELLGAQVRTAYDGPQGIEAFGAWQPSVVLLDIGMPGMNGYEVAATLRRSDAGARCTLIALSGWGQQDDRARARAAGFDHHLVKPADIDAIERLILASTQA